MGIWSLSIEYCLYVLKFD
ncbi:hypothetical protein F1003_00935 [Winogradskyella sp. ZXX205]|uniref:Uncharacterized protein n=1 Tax=Winogradskyella ouciana TaxID=2608631 RepID=A0A7K1G871_9FLAO|nr:hypothetical protein [Winogradskyella ouciana]